ncbi:hypothetical protein [Dietzia alimentaria]|uniref:hypothetical protein n=1 Tax=Dietzia alimentaria TaxID=665550 RepID=UPI0011454A2C|nr:hypothetical protein [Dietzia alimentaria]
MRSRDGMAWRLHAVLPPVAVDGTCLSLRVSRPTQATFDKLVDSGTVPADVEPVVESPLAMDAATTAITATSRTAARAAKYEENSPSAPNPCPKGHTSLDFKMVSSSKAKRIGGRLRECAEQRDLQHPPSVQT